MSEFVICIDNDSNPASLILGKVYRTLPDAAAEAHNRTLMIPGHQCIGPPNPVPASSCLCNGSP